MGQVGSILRAQRTDSNKEVVSKLLLQSEQDWNFLTRTEDLL